MKGSTSLNSSLLLCLVQHRGRRVGPETRDRGGFLAKSDNESGRLARFWSFHRVVCTTHFPFILTILNDADTLRVKSTGFRSSVRQSGANETAAKVSMPGSAARRGRAAASDEILKKKGQGCYRLVTVVGTGVIMWW